MKLYDVVFPQNYTVNGEEKTRWLKCGVMIEGKKGPRLKLESLPIGVTTEGGGIWFSLFEPEDKPLKVPGFEDEPF